MANLGKQIVRLGTEDTYKLMKFIDTLGAAEVASMSITELVSICSTNLRPDINQWHVKPAVKRLGFKTKLAATREKNQMEGTAGRTHLNDNVKAIKAEIAELKQLILTLVEKLS